MTSTDDSALVGGHPALDFLNSVDDWTAENPQDRLTGFADAIHLGDRAGVITRAEARRLERADSRAELSRLRRVRAVLERIFRAAVRKKSFAPADLDELAAAGVQVARVARLEGDDGPAVRKRIPLDAAGAATLRLRLIDAAMMLLGSPDLARVKDCPACGWFFLDASKNASRRWCSMEACGASAKSRAYYLRTRRRQ